MLPVLFITCWCAIALIVAISASSHVVGESAWGADDRESVASVELRAATDATKIGGESNTLSKLRDVVRRSAAYISPNAECRSLIAAAGMVVILSLFVSWAAFSVATSMVDFVKLAGAYFALLAAGVIDAKTRTIPNLIPIALVALRVLCLVYEYFFSAEVVGYLTSSLLGGFTCCVALGIANKVSHGGVGMGDVKLVSAVGFLCGLYFVLYVLLFSLVVCVVVALVLMATKHRKKSDSMPFAPFLFFGYVVAVFVSLM